MVTAAEILPAPAAPNGAAKPKQRPSKNQLRREKKKIKKQQASRESSVVTDTETESVSFCLSHRPLPPWSFGGRPWEILHPLTRNWR